MKRFLRVFTLPQLLMVLVLLSSIMPLSNSLAENSKTELQDYVTQLQTSPKNHLELRKKIIDLVRKMKHPPATPEGFDSYMDRGEEAFKEAKGVKDYGDAVEEFRKATLAAPWKANAYYNLALAEQKTGDFARAVQNLKLYLLASPHGSDVKKVKKMINQLEYRGEKAAKEKNKLHSFEGVWAYGGWNTTGDCNSNESDKIAVTINSDGSATLKNNGSWKEYNRMVYFSGNQISFSQDNSTGTRGDYAWTLSEDGMSIRETQDLYHVSGGTFMSTNPGYISPTHLHHEETLVRCE